MYRTIQLGVLMRPLPLLDERPAPARAAVYCTGDVIAAGPEGFAVRSPDGVLGARRAASCLLCPELGDNVLVGGENDESAFVLAVLERAGDGPARVDVDGDMQL